MVCVHAPFESGFSLKTGRTRRRGWPLSCLCSPWAPRFPLAVKMLIRNLLKTEPTQRMTITEFMNHPWIMVSPADWRHLGPRGRSLQTPPHPRSSLGPFSLPPAIDEGPSNPTAHQPGPEGGQGEVGGRQGEGMPGRQGGGGGVGSAVLMEAASPASSRSRSSGTTGTATLSRFPERAVGRGFCVGLKLAVAVPCRLLHSASERA